MKTWPPGSAKALMVSGSRSTWNAYLYSDRAASLTRQLLAFSRMQVLQPRVMSLNNVVEEMGKLIPRLIGEDVELVIRTATDLGAIRADASQMEQVIMNLAVNSRDAMPTGGKLLIGTNPFQQMYC